MSAIVSFLDTIQIEDVHLVWTSQTFCFTKSVRLGRTELWLRLWEALGEIKRLRRVSGHVLKTNRTESKDCHNVGGEQAEKLDELGQTRIFPELLTGPTQIC